MKNVPDPNRRDPANEPPLTTGAPGQGLPEVQESRGRARWIPPVIAIVILVVVLAILGVYYL